MALRVIIEAEGGDYRLLRRPQRVDMIVPPAPAEIHPGGIRAELRDAEDRTLYQHDLSSQLERSVEVFSPDGHIERVAVPERKRTIMLLLPEQTDAESLVLVRHHRGKRRGVRSESAEPEILKRFSLTDEEESR